MYDGHAGSRSTIALRSARAASPIEPVPGPLYSRFFPSFVAFMASIIKSFHCPASIVAFAILEANKNPNARSNVGWFRIVAYTNPPINGSLSTNACAPARRDVHMGSSRGDFDVDAMGGRSRARRPLRLLPSFVVDGRASGPSVARAVRSLARVASRRAVRSPRRASRVDVAADKATPPDVRRRRATRRAMTTMATRAVKTTTPTATRARRGAARAMRTKTTKRFVVAHAAGKDNAVSELAAMDAVIDLMLASASEEELGKIVVENVLMFDQKMWMRFASRSDTATESATKTKIMDTATKCMKLIEAMVEKTESTMEEASESLQRVVGAAADPSSGEFDVPLRADALERMRNELQAVTVDERTLNTLYAWIRKSDENGLDGMVHILQRLLQLYAARELDEKSSALDKVIRSNAEAWPTSFAEISNEGYNETAFAKDLQRRMEGVVLNLPNGSYAQRVQAEYLKEIEDRGKEFFAQAQK